MHAMDTTTRNIKMSADLPRPLYKFVTGFADSMGVADAAEVSRVPHVEVFRALVQELVDDPGLRLRIASRMVENLKAKP